MQVLGIIPARYASTRFPGKPLCLIDGKPMIQCVYERVASVLTHVVVATDDERIRHCVEQFGGQVVMTSDLHETGTDRCAEALTVFQENSGLSFDLVINIQGDEPRVSLQQIKDVLDCFDDERTAIATLVKPFSPEYDDLASLENPNLPKVVLDQNNYALLFSRSVIPYLRGVDKEAWLHTHTYYKHIGLYAFRAQVLQEITQLRPGVLECCESLEQLRWLENGYKIKVAFTHEQSVAIDTPEDLEKLHTETEQKTF